MISNIFASAYDVVAERNYGFAAGMLNLVGGLSGSAGMLLGGWWKGSVGILSLMKWAVVATEIADHHIDGRRGYPIQIRRKRLVAVADAYPQASPNYSELRS